MSNSSLRSGLTTLSYHISNIIYPPPGAVSRVTLWRFINVLSLLAVLISSTLIPITAGRKSMKEVSEQNQVWLTPASSAFGIWSVIYLSHLVFVLYTLLPYTFKPIATQSNSESAFNITTMCIGPCYSISSILQILWIWAFTSSYITTSTIIITFTCFVNLIMWFRIVRCVKETEAYEAERKAMLASDTFYTADEEADEDSILTSSLIGVGSITTTQPSVKSYFLIRAPISLYTGWVFAATVVSYAISFIPLESHEKSVLQATTFPSLCLIGVATVAGLVFAFYGRDVCATIAVAWALLNISYGPIVTEKPGSSADRIGNGAMAGCVVLLLVTALISLRDILAYYSGNKIVLPI